jgi:hypothetical protein
MNNSFCQGHLEKNFTPPNIYIALLSTLSGQYILSDLM